MKEDLEKSVRKPYTYYVRNVSYAKLKFHFFLFARYFTMVCDLNDFLGRLKYTFLNVITFILFINSPEYMIHGILFYSRKRLTYWGYNYLRVSDDPMDLVQSAECVELEKKCITYKPSNLSKSFKPSELPQFVEM